MTRQARTVFAFSLIALAGSAASAQQCLWSLGSPGQPNQATDPTIRQNHMAVFDTVRNHVLMFGGFASGISYGDTWAWNGASWTQVATTGPSARSVQAMAWDPVRSRVVLFGGNAGGFVGDTWEWNGVAWTEIFPATSPPPRYNAAMAFDSTRNRVVLTGGFGATRYNDTWEFDGVTWTQRVNVGTYVARSSHGMEFDPSRNKMVMFGGFGGSPLQRLADTWELGTTGNWTLIAAPGPSGRQYFGSLMFNPDTNRIYLFGGQTGPLSADRVNDLWSYNGAWTLEIPGTPAPAPVAKAPNRRDQHMTAYDRVRHRIVVMGGYQGGGLGGVAGDTWLSGCSTACYANCDQSTGNPLLTANDFQCFANAYAANLPYANCDQSTGNPLLTANDFQCFTNAYAAGCT